MLAIYDKRLTNRVPVQKIFLLAVILLGACAPIVPATTPPQLEHTPGAFVVVTDDTFDAGTFLVDYPAEWRVVKSSIASADYMQIVFVARDDESTVILTEVAVVSATNNPNEQFIALDNDVILQVLVEPADDVDEQFADLSDSLINSIRAGD